MVKAVVLPEMLVPFDPTDITSYKIDRPILVSTTFFDLRPIAVAFW